jgi:NAD(P)-dependent dehydrogenase (short-subunit alcohol dehydrogenase family)
VADAGHGVGRATLQRLAAEGARVFGVAPEAESLHRLTREAAGDARACPGDVRAPGFLGRVLGEADPDCVVLAFDGAEAIAAAQAACAAPLRPGSAVIVACADALDHPATRWLISGLSALALRARSGGISLIVVVPARAVVGSLTEERAFAALPVRARSMGCSPPPLAPEAVARAVARAARGEGDPDAFALHLTAPPRRP